MSAVPTSEAGDRRQATEDTRTRVLRSARAAFASQGYAGASMRKIAAEAGLTAMAVYTYAPSKAELFRLVYEESLDQIYREYAEVVVGKASLLEEVEAILDRGGELLEHDPDLLRFTIRMAADRQQDDLRELDLVTQPTREFFVDLADRAVQRGEIHPRDGVRLVRFVTMLLWGITATTALDPSNLHAAVETAKWTAAGRLSSSGRLSG